ncbi:MAG: LURP-one-related/scramblase family protein [Candidatus Freyarchaeota archaeon]
MPMRLLDYDSYIIDEKLFTMRNTLIIKSEDGREVGRAVAKLFSISGEMNLYDAESNVVGIVKGKLFSVRPTYTLHDHTGYQVATVKGKLFALRPSYQIEDARGNVIYRLEGDFLGREFEVKDVKGNVAAKVTRKLFSLRDHYTLKIHGMDPLLALLTLLAINMDVLKCRRVAASS